MPARNTRVPVRVGDNPIISDNIQPLKIKNCTWKPLFRAVLVEALCDNRSLFKFQEPKKLRVDENWQLSRPLLCVVEIVYFTSFSFSTSNWTTAHTLQNKKHARLATKGHLCETPPIYHSILTNFPSFWEPMVWGSYLCFEHFDEENWALLQFGGRKNSNHFNSLLWETTAANRGFVVIRVF